MSFLPTILWAQWRTLRNFKGGGGARIIAALAAIIWYGIWGAVAVFASTLTASRNNVDILPAVLSWGMMVGFVYWQVMPVITVSLGASLDLKKLLVYPIPFEQMFLAEIMLRLTAGMEVVLVLGGLLVGLLRNPVVPWWAPAPPIVLFIVFNLLVAAGARSLLDRMLTNRRIREVVVFFVVLAAALPQLLTYTRMPANVQALLSHHPAGLWPWTAAAGIALGHITPASCGALLVWIAAAYLFGRWQFERGLRHDSAASLATVERPGHGEPWIGKLYRLPSAFLPDPIAVMVEKELRSLARSPRFRLVFLMGCSFGLLIWLPMSFRHHWWKGDGGFSTSFLTLFTGYALFLMSENVFWNVFAFDRSAAQIYFLLPVRFSRVLVGKNIASLLFVMLQIALITGICLALRLPVTFESVAEALSVCLILCIYLFGVGNLVSVHFPRPVNPENPWGASGRKQRAFLLLPIFAVVLTPIGLAYLARYAFGSPLAFYGVLGFAAAAGVAVYWITMESAIQAAHAKRERLLGALSSGEGPVVAN